MKDSIQQNSNRRENHWAELKKEILRPRILYEHKPSRVQFVTLYDKRLKWGAQSNIPSETNAKQIHMCVKNKVRERERGFHT